MRFHPLFLRATVAVVVAAVFTSCGSAKYTPVVFDNETVQQHRILQLKHRDDPVDLIFRSLKNDTLFCQRIIFETSPGVRSYEKISDRVSADEKLYLQLDPAYGINLDQDVLAIPVDRIKSATVREENKAAAVVGTVTALTLIAVLIIALASSSGSGKTSSKGGSSCPYAYAFDGEDYSLEGEMYSGAILPVLERDDYLRLNAIRPSDNLYRVRITNELYEIQRTNFVELIVCDHPLHTEVLFDKHGIAHTISVPAAPLSATTRTGDTVLHRISHADGKSYDGGIDTLSNPIDGMTLTFPLKAAGDSAKLVIRARNTLWLEFAFAEFSAAFGGMYGDFFGRHKLRRAEDMHQWMREQSIPLIVSIRTGDGWTPFDAFNLAGPLAFRDDIMTIPLPRNASQVEIRLEWGHSFWDIDYVALDESPDEAVFVSAVPLHTAVEHSGQDLRDVLARRDTLYHVMPNIGDAAELSFEVPPTREGTARTVVLHSRGNYQSLHQPSGPPDLPRLLTLREPGSFPRLARAVLKRCIEHLQASR